MNATAAFTIHQSVLDSNDNADNKENNNKLNDGNDSGGDTDSESDTQTTISAISNITNKLKISNIDNNTNSNTLSKTQLKLISSTTTQQPHTFTCAPRTYKLSTTLSTHRRVKRSKQQQLHDKNIQSMWQRINTYDQHMLKLHNPAIYTQRILASYNSNKSSDSRPNTVRSTNDNSKVLHALQKTTAHIGNKLNNTVNQTNNNNQSTVTINDNDNNPYTVLKTKLVTVIDKNNITKSKSIIKLLNKAKSINTHLDSDIVNNVCNDILAKYNVNVEHNHNATIFEI